MGKRRFSEFVTNVIRANKTPHLQRRRFSRTCTSFASVSPHYAEDDVLAGVHTMAAEAAGLPIDDVIRTTVPSDSFWHPDRLRNEPGPSHPSPTRSKGDLSSTAASPAASHISVQTLPSASPQDASHRSQSNGIFFLRSDADSLRDAVIPTSPATSVRFPPSPPTSSQMHAFPASPQQLAGVSSAAPQHQNNVSSLQAANTHASPPVFGSPSSSNASPDSALARPIRAGRPTLTRLNTSEMLRTQTGTALELASTQPIATRKSPTALKLQLDTSVPRRSATLSSFPHPNRSKHKHLLHPPLPLPLLKPRSPVEDLLQAQGSNAASFITHDPAARLGPTPDSLHADAANVDPSLIRSNFGIQDFDFEVSTILSDFLYLGPDIQSEHDVTELKAIGVRRILNVACEIDDLGPLKLRDRFERYLKLPMLDSVEAKGVQDSIQEACAFIDDARLRSEPVYVHCKAGKSRSVTIVIAYLIHALGWTLQRAYSYVVEKRAAICPNIGFVAELMRFEEQELKLPRSTGIYGNAMATASTTSPISRSSPQLPTAETEGQGYEHAKSDESAPSLSMPSHELPQRGFHKHLIPDVKGALGGTLSKSSPDLPSMAFGSH